MPTKQTKQKKMIFTNATMSPKKKRPRAIRLPRRMHASYDSTKSTPLNRVHWSNADKLGAFDSACRQVREVLRSRSRYECVENNSYLKGMVLTLANATIGTGPRLMLDTKDPELTQTIEHNFRQWSKALNLAEKLRLFRQAKIVDGESFGIITENPHLASDFTLDMQIIECDLVSSPDFTETMENVDGIHYDGLIPTFYDILTDHPNAKTPSGTGSDVSTPEPAGNVIHYFRADRAGQRRGIPEVASALELCAMMRRYTLAVTTAAEAIASFGTGVMTGGDPNDYSDIGEAYDEFDLTHGMILSLPGGRDFKQLKAEQPSTTYKEFMRTLLSQIARCLNMPLNVALGDSSGYNFASGRLDHQFFFRSIQIERNKIECEILSRLFIKWLEEAALLGIVPVAALDMVGDWRINWIWDSFEHVDPVKEATASSLLLAAGFTDEFSETARYGKDYRDVVERRKMARELRAAFGEPEPAPLSGLTVQEEEDDEESIPEPERDPRRSS